MKAKGNVKVEDKVKNYTIISNNITYFKNLEKFVSKEKSEAFDKDVIIKADEFEYNKILNIVNANNCQSVITARNWLWYVHAKNRL